MQFTLLTTLAAAMSAVSVAGWSVTLTGKDGRAVDLHGRLDAGCTVLSHKPSLNVNNVKFDGNNPWPLDDAEEVLLYTDTGCTSLSYNNSPGNYAINPRVIKAYRVTS